MAGTSEMGSDLLWEVPLLTCGRFSGKTENAWSASSENTPQTNKQTNKRLSTSLKPVRDVVHTSDPMAGSSWTSSVSVRSTAPILDEDPVEPVPLRTTMFLSLTLDAQ